MRMRTPVPAPEFRTQDIHGTPIYLDALRGKRVLLSFFRDAACPFCNLRVYELSNEYPRLSAQGMEVVVVFRSTREAVQRFIDRRPRPFRLVADPDMAVFAGYGVERSVLGLLRAMYQRMPRLLRGLGLGRARLPASSPTLMPADFLIDERGYVRRAFYGRDLGDHLPLEAVHRFAARARSMARPDAIATGADR